MVVLERLTIDESDLVEEVVSVKRVAKVVKGGKRFGFAVIVVVGNKKGIVGYGQGKGKEVTIAKEKAKKAAMRSLRKIPLRDGRTLHHDIQTKFGSANVVLRSAQPGRGIIAGGVMRTIFECLGVQDIVAKSLGSSNPYNMLKATLSALDLQRPPKDIAKIRNLTISDIISRRTVIEGE